MFATEFEKTAMTKKDMAKRVSDEMDVDKKDALKSLAQKAAETAVKKKPPEGKMHWSQGRDNKDKK